MMTTRERLRTKILDRTAVLSVIGQGYVGLTLAAAAAEAGFRVHGIDVDAERVAGLRAGTCVVPGVDPDLVSRAIATGRLTFGGDADPVAASDVTVICVPTPLRDHTPDLRSVETASEQVAARLAPGALVVLESTTYPGTTDEVVAPRLGASGLVPGQDFFLAYSPERIDPGNVEWNLANTPKIVGGVDDTSGELATLFYAQLCEKVLTVSSCRSAEMAKLLENTFRHVNIALVNEMAMICHEMGIDVWEVLDATASKPFGFTRFTPGPGVGGHCIPVDPTYLTWKVRAAAGMRFQVVETAEDVNGRMPAYVATRIGDALNERGRVVRDARILVLGVTYKPDVGDVRESPSIQVMTQLERRGAAVEFHDPFVDAVPVNGSTIERVELDARALASADCVALLTPHSSYDLDWLIEHARLLFDARNAADGRRAPNVMRL